MIFKQLFDQTSGTFSYLLADEQSREAIFIDTVFEQHDRDLALINELGLSLKACLETHCHADHVTGAWLMKKETGCHIGASPNAGIELLDIELREGDSYHFGRHTLRAIDTPGHTNGCISLVLDAQSMVFTGDTLLIRGCGRTDFQQGSASRLFHSIRDKLFSLPDDCVVFPAHDYNGRIASTIGEEKKFNPRIGGQANEGDFVGFMENMQLPHPRQIEIAVPANVKAGKPDKLPEAPLWAPVVTTYGGSLEITPQWVAANRAKVNILDVRSETELVEENSGIEGAVHIPVGELRERLDEVPIDKPVMTICRSGKRSGLAANVLKQNGWEQVANISGGLLRWQEEGLPTSD